MNYTHPEYLISSEELQKIIGNDNVKVFDTSVLLHQVDGAHKAESGIEAYLEKHIQGAGFIDLINDWSDTDSALNHTLPPLDALCKAIGDSGINQDDEVILYSSGHLMWATRAWWCLHYAGHTNIKVLNGNIRAWRKAGLPCESGRHEFAKAEFFGSPKSAVFTNTQGVEAGLAQNTCTINALTTPLYEGTGDFFYKRRGHIPGSLSLPFSDVLDNEFFLEPEALAATLERQGMLSAENVIVYCGGGIAATLDAFACKLLGQDRVSVYDGSMSEWVLSEDRTLTVGANP
ncbi:sulfurtransferase [bacterium]|nr:sulfurtransferase [bacterium]MDB9797681.1 sulfurtransferase [Pseudomonadales bacterium]